MRFLGSLLPILIIVALIAMGISIGMYFEKKRREAFAKAAADLGLEFFPLGIPGLLVAIQGFTLFSSGRGHTVANTIRGLTDDVELTIFDLTYTTGNGKHSHTHRQTIIRFSSSRLQLPEFTLSPEWFFHTFAKIFGFKDIIFEEDQKFSSAFLLQGPSQTALRH